jgi:hypothetical protein
LFFRLYLTYLTANNPQESMNLALPVRVIRGPSKHSKYAPPEGYRYDGLYDVTEAVYGKSRNGEVRLCKFTLVVRTVSFAILRIF